MMLSEIAKFQLFATKQVSAVAYGWFKMVFTFHFFEFDNFHFSSCNMFETCRVAQFESDN